MTSLFRARRRSEDEAGSGGKILRGRRAAPSASPYLRPQRPPPPPSSPPESPNPSWLTGLISGAGKLISSVFTSDGSSPSSSSSSSSGYSSDEDNVSTSNDDIEASSEELLELNQGGTKPELKKDHVGASSAIIPMTESKFAIAQLLMQETFSRDECKNLTEIIQSRVVDYPSCEVGEDEKKKEIRGAYRSSFNSLIALSPGLSVLQARTPDLQATAVTEAKKWFEEKKTATSSNANLDCGPCTLNTDMLQYGIEGEVGSPVDMAKSYMRSLPPWQSPSLCSNGFKTPPPRQMHLYKAETSYATTNHSLPSCKVLKRNNLSVGPCDTLEEIRRVRLKLTDTVLEIPNYRQNDSYTSSLDHRTCKISSATENKVLCSENHCTNEALNLLEEKSTVVSHPMETGNSASVSIISKPEEALYAVQPINESPVPTTLESCHSEIGSASKFSDHNVHNLDINHDVEEPSQTRELIGSISAPHESLVLASTPVNHDDPLSSAKIKLPEEIKSAAPSDVGDVTNTFDVHSTIIQSSSGVGERLQTDKSSQLIVLEERHPISDSMQKDGNAQVQKEAEGTIDKITADGAPTESNTSSDHEPLGEGGISNTDEPARDLTEGTGELQTEAAAAAPVHGADANAVKSENGTRMKSIERLLTGPQPGTSRRGRKSVVRPKRGRGKLK